MNLPKAFEGLHKRDSTYLKKSLVNPEFVKPRFVLKVNEDATKVSAEIRGAFQIYMKK